MDLRAVGVTSAAAPPVTDDEDDEQSFHPDEHDEDASRDEPVRIGDRVGVRESGVTGAKPPFPASAGEAAKSAARRAPTTTGGSLRTGACIL